MARVQLEAVRKIYVESGREQVAVHDVSLEVADGEFVVLVGPSGCGKSTTLRMIAGLEDISAGTIRIGDRVVNDVAARDRDIAMVFQNYALYPHMSVRDNLAFALTLRKLPPAEIAARVAEASRLLGLDDLLDRKPRQLSGGQRQRVAVGRAIVRQPQVFLFDEPLSNLDAKLRVQMRRDIAALRRRLNATTIYVTHDQVEAMTLGDRIVVMQDGRVQQVDAPLAIYQRPVNTFVATFIGSPPMNLVRGRLERDTFVGETPGFRLPLGPGSHRPPVTVGQPVVLGVRPESFTLQPAGQGGIVAQVGEVEPLGSETILTLDAAGVHLTARLEGVAPVQRGATIELAVPPGALHWFDGATEARLP